MNEIISNRDRALTRPSKKLIFQRLKEKEEQPQAIMVL